MDLVGKLQGVGGFLIVLGLVVFVHEFGHFAVAKLLRMRVFVFSFGFGQRLWGFKWGDTDCRLSLLPLGGYVRLEGEPEDALSGGGDPSRETRALTDGTLVSVQNPDYFTNRPRWQRILVYLAGPLMNAVLTIAVLTVFHMVGFYLDHDRPTIGAVAQGSPAEQAGLLPGDEIVSVDGKPVQDWENAQYAVMIRPAARFNVKVRRADGEHELQVQSKAIAGQERVELGDIGWYALVRVGRVAAGAPAEAAGVKPGDGILSVAGRPVTEFKDVMTVVTASEGQPLEVVLWRERQRVALSVAPRLSDGAYRLGIESRDVWKKLGFLQALEAATARTWTWTTQALDTLWQLVRGRMSTKTLSGPIGIAKASAQAAQEGAFQLFFMVAFISLQVGLLNLILPFVPFDGGHLALLVTESVMRRDLSARARDWVMNAGFGVVILLIALVFYSDLSKLSFFGRFLP